MKAKLIIQFDVFDYITIGFVGRHYKKAFKWIHLCNRYSGMMLRVFDNYAIVTLVTRERPGRPAQLTKDIITRRLIIARLDDNAALLGLNHEVEGVIICRMETANFISGSFDDILNLPLVQ